MFKKLYFLFRPHNLKCGSLLVMKPYIITKFIYFLFISFLSTYFSKLRDPVYFGDFLSLIYNSMALHHTLSHPVYYGMSYSIQLTERYLPNFKFKVFQLKNSLSSLLLSYFILRKKATCSRLQVFTF